MKRKYFNEKQVKDYLRNVFPHAKNILVKVTKNAQNEYKSLIEIALPARRKLVAVKKGVTKVGSLDRSKKAIIRQIHKVKTKWKKDVVSFN